MWRLAFSLDVLLAQVNVAYPNRSKASDGTIGDAAHQAVPSDHNPNPQGVVCALDLTNDPPRLNAHALADNLLAVRHPDLKYLISNRRIAGAWTNWKWTVYTGTADPHINHIHISVGVGPDGQSKQPYDDKIKWNVKGESMANLSRHDAGRMVAACWGRPATEAELVAYTKVDELTMLKRILADKLTDANIAQNGTSGYVDAGVVDGKPIYRKAA